MVVDIDDIRGFLVKKEPLITETMYKVIPSKGLRNLYDAMEYHLNLGGKRIRPGLCLLVAERLGLDVGQVVPFAASLELLHNFTLIHDDLQDRDSLRRGKPAVWVKYGIPHAINVGDGLYTKVYELVLKSEISPEKKVKLIDIVAKTALTIVEGQAMDMNFRGRSDVKEDEYMDMIWRKTGIMFGSALSGPAYIADAPENVQKVLLEYGKLIGPAFQIRDDVIDLDTNSKKGRELGADVKEGKRSLIIIDAFNKIKEKDRLLKILDKPKEETSKEEIGWVIENVNSTGSVEYAMNRATELAKEAKQKLEILENKQLKEELSGLSDYVISRRD